MVKRNKTEKDYFCCKYSTLVVIGQCTDPYQIFVMCMLRLHMKFVFMYICRYLYTPRLYLGIENAYIAHYRFSYAFHPKMSLLQKTANRNRIKRPLDPLRIFFFVKRQFILYLFVQFIIIFSCNIFSGNEKRKMYFIPFNLILQG